MNLDQVRRQCLSFPFCTEHIQWGNNLVFKIGGKIFAIAATEPGEHQLSFKCTLEDYAELIERSGIAPAPYLARAHWVALETLDVMPAKELSQRLRTAYELVFAKLPKKTRAAMAT